jgi:hypothetical protein
MNASTGAITRGTYDPAEYAVELEAAPTNHDVGTTLRLHNDRVRVWEVALRPGEREPFHSHATDYLWTVVEAGRGLQRFVDGTYAIRDYEVGDTMFLEHTPETALIHDLENIGDTLLRFVTVELLG